MELSPRIASKLSIVIFDKLSGKDGLEFSRELQRLLNSEAPFPLDKSRLEKWHPIGCHTQGSVIELCEKLRTMNVRLTKLTESLIDCVPQGKPLAGSKIETVRASGAEFGFARNFRRCELYRRAAKEGLHLVDPVMAFHIFLEIPPSINGWIHLAMEPIKDCIFAVGRGGGRRHIAARKGDPVSGWPVQYRWLFRT